MVSFKYCLECIISMVDKKFSKVNFGKIFGDLSLPVVNKCTEFEDKEFDDFILFGVKKKVLK